ncbi:MAG: tetraacyldisaccharide 4'-kinase [Deltaproteobacteria bacterium]|nr:tetraacyldisaccharide 4'-kinase [Deltaproteobacteria bacterium]MBW2417257.1 tetraacyldisaccharide 4'-kinase [Deltaproteobacteria bacterium]
MWRAALLPMDLAALPYGLTARAHRKLYEKGLLERRRLSCRVLSVGSVTVGGAGKTPAAAWVAAALHRRGYRVVIATRGYGRARREAVTVVSDGRTLRSDPPRAGDEALVLAAHAPGVPVLVGRDRGIVGLRAIAAFGAQVLVLDDGLQHHRLARDGELLVLDGALGLGNRRLLPRGPLREPVGVASRAGAICIVDGPLPEADARLLDACAPGAPRFEARRRPAFLRPLAGGATVPPELLDGMEVGMLSAIARPDGFRRTLEGLGARVVAERRFRDHHRYRSRDLAGLRRQTAIWVTTEKDAVKLLPSWTRGADLRVLGIELAVEGAARLVDWLESRLVAGGGPDEGSSGRVRG